VSSKSEVRQCWTIVWQRMSVEMARTAVGRRTIECCMRWSAKRCAGTDTAELTSADIDYLLYYSYLRLWLALGLWLWFTYYLCEPCLHCVFLWFFKWYLAVTCDVQYDPHKSGRMTVDMYKYMSITTNQPDTKSYPNPNPNPNPTTKHSTKYITCPTSPSPSQFISFKTK